MESQKRSEVGLKLKSQGIKPKVKTIQEAITLIVFVAFTLIFFKEEKLAWNHLVGFGFLVAAVFFIFKKW